MNLCRSLIPDAINFIVYPSQIHEKGTFPFISNLYTYYMRNRLFKFTVESLVVIDLDHISS